ncbi:hypothetical protein BC749_107207 [Flavobacterium araucananum]|jgi:hypothetical protein|uniref:hypothetical protein n=1 Tax=Flavobacterium araucananum TaxID=946678 RepID=UPI000D78F113|nr:hypothetical protein [Flavobacterium araucananum]PWJ97406.1 hypothetical protein BC749_107207 [Flavobacterium araucananum]
MIPVSMQIIWLFILVMPIACAAWTVTHEEVLREPRDYCTRRSKTGRSIAERKFFYLFTCEYCFSHYATIAALIATGYKLLMQNWTGYLIAGFALVWIANFYMGLFGLLRQDIKKEKNQITEIEKNISSKENLPD